MRVVIQRAASADVTVDGDVVGELTSPGLLVLAGITHTDTSDVVEKVARKIWSLRILDEERSASDTDAPILVVSQFTLAADTRTGNRPGFSAAAPPDDGRRLYECFARDLSAQGVPVQTGEFGGDMKVSLLNDGPVTIWMDSADRA